MHVSLVGAEVWISGSRYDRGGGLMTYGIPGFKLEKDIVMQRMAQLEDGGIEFVLNCDVGDDLSFDAIRGKHEACLLYPPPSPPDP